MSDSPQEDISLSVLRALQNERCLDVYFRRKFDGIPNIDKLPNYKVLKLGALYERFSWFYGVVVTCAMLLIPVLTVLRWLEALVFSMAFRKNEDTHVDFVISTSKATTAVIRSALPNLVKADDDSLLSIRRVSSLIGFWASFISLGYCAKLYYLIGRAHPGQRKDLILHSRDALLLVMLTQYALMRPHVRFITDDHYQRWAYLLSKHSKRLVVVQHGFINSDITFENSFGTIDTLYIRDPSFAPFFLAYFTVNKIKLFSVDIVLFPAPGNISKNLVLLASSFPAIDKEIELLNAISSNDNIQIVVKFHPNHVYDSRKERLRNLASYICRDNEYPKCRVFISYNSFLEYDYRAKGIQTFSILRDGVENIVGAVNHIVGQPRDPL